MSRTDSGKEGLPCSGSSEGHRAVHTAAAGCHHVAHEWRALARAVHWDLVLFGNLCSPISCVTFFLNL